jgi:leucyl-tRNA synthetase
MTIIYNKHQQKNKRKYLRNNSTIAERMLWNHFKNKQLGVKFRRQYGIGYYIADFCCPRKKLVIEVEGGVHDSEEQIYYDRERKQTIEDLGFTVIRFNNEDVINNLRQVIRRIKREINAE